MPSVNNKDQRTNRLIYKFAKNVSKKELVLAGIGGGIDHRTGKHQLFSVSFEVDVIESLDYARVLLSETICEFIIFLNKQKEIREDLVTYPLTIRNIDVTIVARKFQPGDLVFMYNQGEKLFYHRHGNDPEGLTSEEAFKEIYREAL